MKKLVLSVFLGAALLSITAPNVSMAQNYEQERLCREAREAEAARVERERAYKSELMRRGGYQAVQEYEQEKKERRTRQQMEQMQILWVDK